jgi:hypothetical protein
MRTKQMRSERLCSVWRTERPILRRSFRAALVVALSLAMGTAASALAHQPFFEEEDIKADNPWQIEDPTVSTAIYATLDSPADVDYFTFRGEANQSILLQMTIPQIEGQEQFAPVMALMGPALPATDLPAMVERPLSGGAVLLPPLSGPATTFFEPFSKTSYWERQEERVTLPEDGSYLVAVWHQEGQVGRYVFVVGDKEQLGGDLTFPLKMRNYWTPVGSEAPTQGPPVACVVLPGAFLAVAVALGTFLFVVRQRRKRRPQQSAGKSEQVGAG